MKHSLYHTNPYLIENTALVTEILEVDGQYHVQLDASLFYPEGGGQPCDTGTIDSIPVLSVYENESGIYHVLSAQPHTNHQVPCKVDWTRRFDHMQQHTGQHLLSSVMDHLYDAATVGFRLTDSYVTIDLDKHLTDEEIVEAEQEANRLIWANKPIKAYWPDADTLGALPLRKQPKVDENIRIIEVDGYDYSPCCGTHVNFTGEIGLIKISRFENYKSGVRLEFRCGRRALEQFSQLIQISQVLGRELSVSPEALLPAFERFKTEKEAMKEYISILKSELQSYESARYMSEAENFNGIRIIARVDSTDIKELKSMTGLLVQNPATVVLFGSNADDKAQILLQRSADLESLDMKAVFTAVAPLINARGGGSKNAAQGGGDGVAGLNDCIDKALQLIISSLHYPENN